MIYRVGLTGGIASGKSTVARRLRERGIPVLDADQIVRDLYRPGGEGSRIVSEEFGPEYVDASGAVDRGRLALHVFRDPAALATLNARIHPLVLAEQERWFAGLEAAGAALGVVEATLMIETGGRIRYHHIVTLSAPAGVRLERAVKREPGANPEELSRRIRAQISDAEREEKADTVLRSDREKEALLEQVDLLAAKLVEDAARFRR